MSRSLSDGKIPQWRFTFLDVFSVYKVDSHLPKRLLPMLKISFIPKSQRQLNIHHILVVINHINGFKDRNDRLIHIDEEKAFGIIQHSFMIIVLERRKQEEPFQYNL